MDLNNLRSISNSYGDVRLVSLKDWRQAAEIAPRDHGGPYMVMQEGYDPADPRMDYDEFVLGRSGAWTTVGIFLQLPREARRQEFVYGTAAEVIGLLENLTAKPIIIRSAESAAKLQQTSTEPADDDLSTAFKAAKQATAPPSPSPDKP